MFRELMQKLMRGGGSSPVEQAVEEEQGEAIHEENVDFAYGMVDGEVVTADGEATDFESDSEPPSEAS
jgi:hypothetical protein